MQLWAFDRHFRAAIDTIGGYFNIYNRDRTKSGQDNKECLLFLSLYHHCHLFDNGVVGTKSD